MATPNGEAAIACALETGNALLKFVSANDVNKTGAHQYGFYLPKEPGVWEMFTYHPPIKGNTSKEIVSIQWQIDEYVTESAITWYGSGTRSEYRLTRFGRGFPYITHDSVGDLLVLVPLGQRRFRAFLLDREEDVEELVAALGIQIGKSWGVFQDGNARVVSEEECVERAFGEFVQALTSFPKGVLFSQTARDVVARCVRDFAAVGPDVALVRWMHSEYHLFRMAERLLCANDVRRLFRDIEEFLATASSIMQRRKSRAGQSLENHVEALLTINHIPHQMRSKKIEGVPDVVIPGLAEYEDSSFPLNKLFVLGIKTTCKDRWRQVLNEGRRVERKHFLTLQQGISVNQLREMNQAKVSLVVPAEFTRTILRIPQR
jgi:hypothetical protein